MILVLSPMRTKSLRPWHSLLLLCLWPMLAMAIVVSAEQVANAVRNSPQSTPWMKAHADEVGALAIKVESGGNTTAYNGSCCYGVLQLNSRNIRDAGFTPDQYRNASLQTQVNAWAAVQSQALGDPIIQSLQARAVFDGQPVDASLLLSCVQLGQGNCRRMVRSGRCSGFADINGTTICSMASTMRAAIGGPSASTPTPISVTPPAPSPAPGWTPSPSAAPIDTDEAYYKGSGHRMSELTTTIKMALSALVLLTAALSISGAWSAFSQGQSSLGAFMQTNQKMLLVLLGMFAFFIWQ
jgi:hypothetical protein